jgi:hypothetical protein
VIPKKPLETRTGFTISGWYRVDERMTGVGCPFNKVHDGETNSWQLCFNTDLSIQFFTVGGNEVLVGDPVPLATWTHVALTWDGTTKQIYVNGFPGPRAMAVTEFNGGVIGIGADYDEGDAVAHFYGDIDDLRIYDRALTLDEIAATYNAAP